MTQPDAAGTRSLEEILASIRKSLSEETVDGIVELSAAAAAAARAEAKPANGGKAAAPAPKHEPQVASGTDPLSDKLAGALNSTDAPVDDLADVLAESAPHASASPKVTATPGSSSPADEDKDPLWFLRPGAPEEPNREAPKGPLPKLEIDPFSGTRPRQRTDAASEAEPAAAAKEQEQIRTTPRLDPDRLNRINALKPTPTPTPAVEASPVEVAPEVDEPVDEPVEDETPETPLPAASPAPTAASDAAPTDTGLLTRRDAPRVPLFGGATDKRKPIVSAPLPSLLLVPDGDEEAAPAPAEREPAAAAPKAVVVPDEPAAPLPATSEPAALVSVDAIIEKLRAEPVLLPAAALAPASASEPEQPATAEDAADAAASPNRPLEEMIAAVLEPVLQKLLERNLTPMLEEMVRREVEKALKRNDQG